MSCIYVSFEKTHLEKLHPQYVLFVERQFIYPSSQQLWIIRDVPIFLETVTGIELYLVLSVPKYHWSTLHSYEWFTSEKNVRLKSSSTPDITRGSLLKEYCQNHVWFGTFPMLASGFTFEWYLPCRLILAVCKHILDSQNWTGSVKNSHILFLPINARLKWMRLCNCHPFNVSEICTWLRKYERH